VGALLTGLALVAFLLLLSVALLAFQRHAARPASDRDERAPPLESPLAEAEFEEGAIRGHLEAEQRKKLETYGWVSRERGVVRIPIERAMSILGERRERGPR
jgi:hypothetical protein